MIQNGLYKEAYFITNSLRTPISMWLDGISCKLKSSTNYADICTVWVLQVCPLTLAMTVCWWSGASGATLSTKLSSSALLNGTTAGRSRFPPPSLPPFSAVASSCSSSSSSSARETRERWFRPTQLECLGVMTVHVCMCASKKEIWEICQV